MKIVILQSMYDALGGIYYVNNELMKMFHDESYEIYLLSVRMSGYYYQVSYPEFVHDIIINDKEEWGTIRLQNIIAELKKGHLISAWKDIVKRFTYSQKLKIDYKKTKEEISKIKPDFIINSHYELLNAIPNEYLNKTIMHFHTNFEIIKKNWSYKKIFDKFKNKIYKFVWLTEATEKEAIKYGYQNSTHIYNSVKVKNDKIIDINKNKNLIFLGRISKEKRLDIALNVFNEISKIKRDWTLSIYAIGSLNENERKIIDANPNINFLGPTSNVAEAFTKASINLNTSDFEGFSMTILEANEFGIPTISFEFGESVHEEIINNKTGVIIEKGNIQKYQEELLKLMGNEEKLKELSINCKKFNKEFSYDKVKKEWLKLLKGEK